MKTHTLLHGLLAALLLAGAGPAPGQIGLPSADLFKRYGNPILADTNAAGIHTLQYRKDGFDIAALGRDGVALRVIYRKNDLTSRDVQRLLDLNRGNAEWAPLVLPATPDDGAPPAAWLRSDDRAMASLNGNEFSVTAGGWNHLPPVDVKGPPVAPTHLAAPVPTEPPPVPPPPPAPVYPPKPGRPSCLPSAGDTRTRVCDILGPPQGSIEAGSHEILQYPWGQVSLAAGKVMRVD